MVILELRAKGSKMAIKTEAKMPRGPTSALKSCPKVGQQM
jgi:hypothetical protein